MKVLVTGGSGFVGLNIVEALLERSDDVIAASDADFPQYAQRLFERLPGTLSSARLDVADAAATQTCFGEHCPQAVVHAAAITAGGTREWAEHDRVVDVNVKGTSHVLTAAMAHSVGRVLYVSSGSAYGGTLLDRDAVSEHSAPEPDSLYSITKHAGERLCARFHAMHGLNVVCARLGSVFGPWERDTGVRDTLSLPYQIVRHAAAGETVILPRREARRDWVYAADVASGILALLDANGARQRIYNLSSGARWSAFTLRWCETLQRGFPGFRFRVAAEDERPNVTFLGDSDRALMSIDRIRADTLYRPHHTDTAVFADYAAWLETHRAYYEWTEKRIG